VGLVLAWGAAALERRYGASRLRLPATVAPALVPVAAPAPVAATLGGRNGP
jgi:hypothetical protein